MKITREEIERTIAKIAINNRLREAKSERRGNKRKTENNLLGLYIKAGKKRA